MPDYVHLLRKTNGGVSAARRYAYERAKGRYIAFNDDDDLCCRASLEPSSTSWSSILRST